MNGDNFTLREKQMETFREQAHSELNSYHDGREPANAENVDQPYELHEGGYLKLKNERVEDFVKRLKQINSELEKLDYNSSTRGIISKKTTSYSNTPIFPTQKNEIEKPLQSIENKNIFNVHPVKLGNKKTEYLNKTFQGKGSLMNPEGKETVSDIMAMKILTVRSNKNNYSKVTKNSKVSSPSQSTMLPPRPKSTEASRIMSLERLYYRGLAMKEKSKKILLSVRDQKIHNEMKECTFSPKMNGKNIIWRLRATYSGGEKFRPLDYLATQSYRRPSKITTSSLIDLNRVSNRSNKFLQKAKINNFTSVSNIYNDRSSDKFEIHSNRINTITHNTSKSHTAKNIYHLSKSCDKLSTTSTKKARTEEELIQYSQKLHNDAEKYKFNKEKLTNHYLTENYPFHPKIADKNKPNIYNFFFRLQKWVDKRNEKYEYDLEKTNYDNNTGLRLFAPEINEQFTVIIYL